MSEQKIRYLPNGRIETLNETSLNEGKAVKWNGRPNLNGNSPESFKKAGQEIHDIAQKAYEKLKKSPLSEIMHGRNYQSVGAALAAAADDRKKIEKIFAALKDLQDIGLEIYDIGVGK